MACKHDSIFVYWTQHRYTPDDVPEWVAACSCGQTFDVVDHTRDADSNELTYLAIRIKRDQ